MFEEPITNIQLSETIIEKSVSALKKKKKEKNLKLSFSKKTFYGIYIHSNQSRRNNYEQRGVERERDTAGT